MSPQLYLASQSPRRQVLLQQLGIRFETLAIDIDESWDGKEWVKPHVERLAVEKARAGRLVDPIPGIPVLGADTAVVLDGEILGKATDSASARAMLQRLAGRCHDVYTAVAIVTEQSETVQLSISQVHMHPLKIEEIDAYCVTEEPLGKAGGYAIQGLAAAFINRLEGSYTGVMGLPLFETAALLKTVGIRVLAK